MKAAVTGFAALSLALAAMHGAQAQDRVYRCGASYSHEPCTGSSTVAVDDTRSAGQVAQANKVAQIDARLAETLAREREQAERAAARQGPIIIGAPKRVALDIRAERGGRPHKRAKAEPVTLYRAPGNL